MPVYAINMESGGIAPLIVNICSRWMGFVSCMLQLPYPMGTTTLKLLEYESFVFARTGLDALD